jgi:SAM-dependent methyltransferase
MLQSTADESYTERLVTIEKAWWRKVLDPQIPYRWFLQRQLPGFMLEIGCGLGRNLINNGGRGVGLDHNPTSVAFARSRGLTAMTPEEFESSKYNSFGRYDSLLFSHVVEHMSYDDALKLVSKYLPYVKSGGKLILICPQHAGFKSDKTHVEYFELNKLQRLAHESGASVIKACSFPFPSLMGTMFTYNEWVIVATV